MDFLPEVVDNFEPEENDMNIKVEVEDVSDDDEDIPTTPTTTETIEDVMPKPKSKKEKLNVNEVFDLPKETPIQPMETPTNVKLTKKGVPRKKRPPMSEEHKQKLALAREKAMEARKKKAADKKVQKALDMEEKELLKKQKHKRVQKLKEEVDEEAPPQPIKSQAIFTAEQLEEAQLNAIMNYEKIRKTRKAQKKEQQKKDMEQEVLKQTIRRAVQPQQEFNPYQNCY
tara:strand:- start:1359 stop:2042 length:684 start_codon:yes stop_codon:yes gene_type:complete